ncbi:MAG TPA: ABC transporter ATP-binding protein [Steroidobacteraceae bacterium]|nr:ABC transporter ATP-binding protein [Steroidobacteraceae bacterium]
MSALLGIHDLRVAFQSHSGPVPAVDGVDLEVEAGECVAVVGESGSGKSQLFHAVMGVLPAGGRASGSARLRGQELLGRPASELNRVRGAEIAMIFQDPMTSLTPHLTIGKQISEVLQRHRGLSAGAARARALELLERVHIGAAAQRLGQYPHELSGGMRQRAMVAMALACEPALLVADEPTTALDVTIQAQLLELFRELRRATKMALILITHDLGAVAGLADRVAVMYAGRIVELAPVEELFARPRHPYTSGLLGAIPRLDTPLERDLAAIPGQPPLHRSAAPGCAFVSRCARALARCASDDPMLEMAADGRRAVACHNPLAGAHCA